MSVGAWVYKQTEGGWPRGDGSWCAGLWTVGHYNQDGTWLPESDHSSPEEAAERVHWLNGGDRS